MPEFHALFPFLSDRMLQKLWKRAQNGGGGTAPEPESAEDEVEETAAGAEGTAAEAAAEAAGAGWEAAQEALRAGLESAHIHLAGAAEKQQSKAKKRVAEYLKRFSGRGKREE